MIGREDGLMDEGMYRGSNRWKDVRMYIEVNRGF